MSSKREVAFYAPDGTEVIYETSGKWDAAGIVKTNKGTWYLAAHGFSATSVRQRAVTSYHRNTNAVAVEVVPIWETTIPLVRDYFGSHRVRIHEVFTPGTGWTKPENKSARRANIRRILKDGATGIAFTDTDRTADFQASELLSSLDSRKVSA